ncbi:MAG: dihydroorotate dehydrogenase electron transfer subunit [Oscillospiraceae bacterium]|nr:dihydroorotate dehydrogenase electron transfer subunit [Oscillospiraceae bacterium]
MPFETARIITNSRISDKIYELSVEFSGKCNPGQFFMLRAPEAKSLLPRPLAVCDLESGALTFVYQAVGRGTGELAAMRAGDILQLNGPLGNGFPTCDLHGYIALVSGGVGIAPMLYTAKKLTEKGCAVHAYCGFKDDAFLADKLGEYCKRVSIATESGKAGTKGLATEIFSPQGFGAVLCCAPEAMAKIIAGQCISANIPSYISMEAKMACGIGACLVCACAMKSGGFLRCCKDGPVFRGGEVDFDA